MFRLIENAITILASLLLLLATLLTLLDVLGRNLLTRPVPGATELTELALVGITFLLYPRLAYRQQHIVIDLFDSFTGPLVRRFQQLLGGVLGAILFGAISWRLWVLAERSMGYGDVTAYLKLPLYPAFYFMSVLAGLTALGFAYVALAAFGPKPPERPGADTAHLPSGVE